MSFQRVYQKKMAKFLIQKIAILKLSKKYKKYRFFDKKNSRFKYREIRNGEKIFRNFVDEKEKNI